MSNYKIKRRSYIDFDHEPTSDELMHFKYIKREKVKGKWRYYYDKDTLKKDVKDAIGITAKEKLASAEREFKDAVKKEMSAKRTAAKIDEYYEDTVDRHREAAKTGYDNYLDIINTGKKYDSKFKKLHDYVPPTKEAREKYGSQGTYTVKKLTKEETAELDRLDDEITSAVEKYVRDAKYYGGLEQVTIPNLEKMNRSTDDMVNRRVQKTIDAGNAYVNTQKAWLDSPLYKFEKASKDVKNTLDAGTNYVKNIFGKKRK